MGAFAPQLFACQGRKFQPEQEHVRDPPTQEIFRRREASSRVRGRPSELCQVKRIMAELVGLCEADNVRMVEPVVLDLHELKFAP